MHSLPLFVRLGGRPVILLGDGQSAAAKRRLLMRAGAVVVSEDHPASLAIVAIDDDRDALAAIDRLKHRGILVNAVDRPVQCDFTLPAIIDRDPVIIAIGTGGASAGLAKALRQRLEAMLPATLGTLATTMKAMRATLRMRWPDARDRRRVIDGAFDEGAPLDPFSPRGADDVERWLANVATVMPPRLEMIRLVSDDPDDLTLRAARLLGQADLLCHTGRVASAILSRARADAARLRCDAPPETLGPGLTLFLDRA